MKINLAKLLKVLGQAAIATPVVIAALKPLAVAIKGKPGSGDSEPPSR